MNEVKELMGLKEHKISVLSVSEENLNKEKIKVITIIGNVKKVKCPICNKYTSSVHDKLKPMKIKFLKMAEQKVTILLIKRRFICHNCKKKITEELNINKHKSTISNKLELKVRKDLLNYNLSIKYIAEENNISDVEVRNILLDAMYDYPDNVKTLPQVISIDEFAAHTSYGKYALIINDPIKKKTLDILPNRKKDYLMGYLTKVENRGNVKYVIGDMYEPYLLVTKAMFKNAKYVVDRFHYVRYIMDAIDGIRKRLQKDYGYNSKEYRMLKNKKNIGLLRKRSNDIDWYAYIKRKEKGKDVYKMTKTILNEMLEISDELDRGYDLKELFLDIIDNSTYETAKEDLMIWIDLCQNSGIYEFVEASKTIENWLEYIVNSFIDKRYSNAYTEGLNNKIKVIKRNGFGYKNFEFFRLRLLYILNGKVSGRSKK